MEMRQFNWISRETMNDARATEIKYVIKGLPWGLKQYKCFLFIKGQSGTWARFFSCPMKECLVCVSDEWTVWDDELNMLRPRCQNPQCGEWVYAHYQERTEKRKLSECESSGEGAPAKKRANCTQPKRKKVAQEISQEFKCTIRDKTYISLAGLQSHYKRKLHLDNVAAKN